MYKSIYNFLLRRTGLETTKYFGSAADFEQFVRSGGQVGDVEIMTHPVMKDGTLFDNTLPQPHPFVTPQWIADFGAALRDFSKTKLLVTFIQTHIGGAMTSLVNFLNALDLSKYEVDVLFYEDKTGGRHGIKEGINLLPPARLHRRYDIGNILSKLLDPPYVIAKIREQYALKIKHNPKRAVQLMARRGCRYSRRLDISYDAAVSYEFSWCMYYTARYVRARRKILWHHLDYAAAGLDFSLDKATFDRYSDMVFVSEETMRKFTSAHPEYSDRSIYMPNLLSSAYVRARGEEAVAPVTDADPRIRLRLITVARLNFEHKGYDRGAEVLRRLKNEGLIEGLRWVIIGDGRDGERLRTLISENGLGKYVFMLGRLQNPIPYLKECDVLFLPSRFEGKPMAVTEAQIMGLVPLVSRYTSADEQIQNGVDGIVVDNSTEALYNGVKDILLHPEKIAAIKATIRSHDFGNTDKIAVFDGLMEK